MSDLKIRTFCVAALVVLSLLCALSAAGCAADRRREREQRVRAMSDEELLARYRGLQAAMSEEEWDWQTYGASSYPPDAGGDHLNPYVPGGRIYEIKASLAAVEQEIRRRGLSP
ncbi:MAG: hypothetical protein ACLFOY_15955 [Desulfatibacillaceae bacterium]